MPSIQRYLLGSVLIQHPVHVSWHLPQFVTMALQLCPPEARKKATGGRCLAEPSELIFPSSGTAMALGKVVLGVFGSTEVKEYVVIGPV